jgi:hypothetical protein
MENGDEFVGKIGEFTKILGGNNGSWQKQEMSANPLLQRISATN